MESWSDDKFVWAAAQRLARLVLLGFSAGCWLLAVGCSLSQKTWSWGSGTEALLVLPGTDLPFWGERHLIDFEMLAMQLGLS